MGQRAGVLCVGCVIVGTAVFAVWPRCGATVISPQPVLAPAELDPPKPAVTPPLSEQRRADQPHPTSAVVDGRIEVATPPPPTLGAVNDAGVPPAPSLLGLVRNEAQPRDVVQLAELVFGTGVSSGQGVRGQFTLRRDGMRMFVEQRPISPGR